MLSLEYSSLLLTVLGRDGLSHQHRMRGGTFLMSNLITGDSGETHLIQTKDHHCLSIQSEIGTYTTTDSDGFFADLSDEVEKLNK